jgi:hypothetical protein
MSQYSCLLALAACSVLAACNKDEVDPVIAACETACTIDLSHPCKAKEAECLSDCKALGGKASSQGYKGDQCGVCIAGLFKYSVNNGQCWGVQKPAQVGVPECQSVCIEPDAGVAGPYLDWLRSKSNEVTLALGIPWRHFD